MFFNTLPKGISKTVRSEVE